MQLKQWLDEERGRALALAKAIKVPPSFVSNMGSGAKQVPFDQCMPIERATNGAVTRRDLRPDDYLIHWPELAVAHAAPVTPAIESIAPEAEPAALPPPDQLISPSVERRDPNAVNPFPDLDRRAPTAADAQKGV